MINFRLFILLALFALKENDTKSILSLFGAKSDWFCILKFCLEDQFQYNKFPPKLSPHLATGFITPFYLNFLIFMEEF